MGLSLSGWFFLTREKQKNETQNVSTNNQNAEQNTSQETNATGNDSNAVTSQSYENKIIGFSIKYPKDWEVKGGFNPDTALLFSESFVNAPDGNNYPEKDFLSYEVLDKYYSLNKNDYLQYAKNDFRFSRDVSMLFENYRLIHEENLNLSDRQGYLIESTVTSGGRQSNVMQLFVEQSLTDGSKRTFRVIGVAPSTNWQVYKDILKISLESFKPLSPNSEWLATAKANRNAVRTSDIMQLQISLEMYYNDNDRYPETLNQLIPKYSPKLQLDPSTNQPYEYTAKSNLKGYTLCATLEGKEKYCKNY